MRKLKLESLQVESFETTTPAQDVRGTVQGHAPGTAVCPGTGASDCAICQPLTYDMQQCGDTQWLDCTYGCTEWNTCYICWIENTRACEA